MAIYYATQKEWTDANKNNFSWYYSTYPFLSENNFVLPISKSYLEGFYSRDMDLRNFTPQKVILDNYDFLFSYFLSNYPNQNNPNRFSGNTTLGYIIENIPKGISMTVDQAKSAFSFTTSTIITIIILIIILIFVFKFK